MGYVLLFISGLMFGWCLRKPDTTGDYYPFGDFPKLELPIETYEYQGPPPKFVTIEVGGYYFSVTESAAQEWIGELGADKVKILSSEEASALNN